MDELTLKIRDLRSRLKDTQQAFANRLRVSLRAVANYESGRRPARAVLWNLAIIASKTGHPDLADIFSSEYSDRMRSLTLTGVNDEETAWFYMVRALLRYRDLVPEIEPLGEGLLDALEQLLRAAKKANLPTIEIEDLSEAVSLARHELTPTGEVLLKKLARERSQKTGETFDAAYIQVLLDHPELYHVRSPIQKAWGQL